MAVETSMPVERTASRTNLRFWVAVVGFLAYMVAFFDRSNVSVLIANKPYTDALGITADKASQGLLLTAFLIAYGLACFLAGPAVNRFGPRRALGYALLSWAGLMAIMGATSSLAIVLAGRAILGLSESVLGPSMSKLVKTWFPVQERAKANGVWFVGLQLAQVLSVPMIAWVTAGHGWSASYYTLALIGIVPTVGAFWFLYDVPSRHPRISAAELEHIGTTEAAASGPAQGSGFGFLRSKGFWLATLVYSAANAGAWGFLGWVPTYFQKTLGFSFKEMGALAALPFLLGAVSAILVTAMMDRFKNRSVFILIACLGFGASLIAAMNISSPAAGVTILSIAMLFLSPIFPGLFAVIQNTTSPREVANATGVFNGVSYLFAAAFPYAMGAMYTSTGNLSSGFYLLAGVALLGVVASIPMVRQRM